MFFDCANYSLPCSELHAKPPSIEGAILLNCETVTSWMTGGATLLPGVVLIISANFQANSASRTLTNFSPVSASPQVELIMACCEQCKVKTKQEFHWTRLLLRYRDWRAVAYTPVSRGCAVDYVQYKGQLGICCKSNGAMCLAVSVYCGCGSYRCAMIEFGSS